MGKRKMHRHHRNKWHRDYPKKRAFIRESRLGVQTREKEKTIHCNFCILSFIGYHQKGGRLEVRGAKGQRRRSFSTWAQFLTVQVIFLLHLRNTISI